MKKFYVTFGQVHAHRVNGKTFDKDSVAEIKATDENSARDKAFLCFGNKWHQCEPEEKMTEDFLSYFPRGIIPLGIGDN